MAFVEGSGFGREGVLGFRLSWTSLACFRYLAFNGSCEGTQRLQNPLTKQYTLHLIRVPLIMYGIFLN